MTVVADQRIRLGSPATISTQIVDQEGDPVAPANAVTVGVTDLAGDDVLAAGTATVTIDADDTVRTVDVPAPAQLDLYTATWTEATTNRTRRTLIDVVGRFYASPTAIRASDAVLADDRSFPLGRIIQARRAVEDEFERCIGYALVPRLRTHHTTVSARRTVTLPHLHVRAVRSLSAAGAVLDASLYELDGPAGVIAVDRPLAGPLEVVYEHGLDAPPAEAIEAFYLRVRDVLQRSRRGVPDRTTTYTSEVGGTYALAVAGRNGSLTGIPDVDVVLRGLAAATPGIG